MEKQTPQCPLGHGDMILDKTWEVKGKGGGGCKRKLWKCPTCGETFIQTTNLENNNKPFRKGIPQK